jgi:hypothetical protein
LVSSLEPEPEDEGVDEDDGVVEDEGVVVEDGVADEDGATEEDGATDEDGVVDDEGRIELDASPHAAKTTVANAVSPNQACLFMMFSFFMNNRVC